jgi:hypothetical protein
MRYNCTIKIFIGSLLIFCTFFSPNSAFTQDYSRVTVLAGSSPSFIFNSLTKYNNGVSLYSWTRLKLVVKAPSHSKWELYVNSQTANIPMDNGVNILDLETFEIIVNIENENETANGGSLSNHTPVTLAYDAGTPILEGVFTGDASTNLEVILTISYECGTKGTNKLLGEMPGYYFVDLVFTLTTVP